MDSISYLIQMAIFYEDYITFFWDHNILIPKLVINPILV